MFGWLSYPQPSPSLQLKSTIWSHFVLLLHGIQLNTNRERQKVRKGQNPHWKCCGVQMMPCDVPFLHCGIPASLQLHPQEVWSETGNCSFVIFLWNLKCFLNSKTLQSGSGAFGLSEGAKVINLENL